MTRAALRDASWCNRPSTDKPVRYHVVRDDGHPGESACGLMVDYQAPGDVIDPQRDAGGVPVALRCMRPGCKARWPASGVTVGDHQTFSQQTPTGENDGKA